MLVSHRAAERASARDRLWGKGDLSLAHELGRATADFSLPTILKIFLRFGAPDHRGGDEEVAARRERARERDSGVLGTSGGAVDADERVARETDRGAGRVVDLDELRRVAARLVVVDLVDEIRRGRRWDRWISADQRVR